MEKLVRRHYRKEPGHLACRAGPILYTLLLTLVAFSTSGAQTMGNPAKVVRVRAAERVAVENHLIFVREEIAEPELPAVDADAAVPAETAAAPVPAAEASAKRERAKKRERVIVLSTGPYLPITGALPLRFASSRKWPAPLPRTEPAREAEATVVATATLPISRPDQISVEPATARVDLVAPAVVVTTAGGPPPAPKPMPTLLTSDIVLGFLDDLPPTESKVSVRFEPAMPQGAMGSAGLGALSQ